MFCLDLFSEVLLPVCVVFFFPFLGFVVLFCFCVFCVCFDKCPVVYSLVSFFFLIEIQGGTIWMCKTANRRRRPVVEFCITTALLLAMK